MTSDHQGREQIRENRDIDHYTISWIFCTTTSGSRTPLPEKQNELPYQAITPIYEEALSIRLHNSASHKYPLHHTWKNLATVGSAGDILLPNVQQMLLRLKKDTGVRYLRFNGIFSDRLLVASADASGNPVYNFAYVDMVLDFLHSIGLKPWIQLSFMPRVLALHPNKYLFNDNVSQPRSNQAWCNLIQVFFQHIRKRYGIEETRTWRYSLWNLPNTASFLYGFDNPEDFQTFYKKYGEKAHGFNRGMNRFEKNIKIQNKRFHFCMSYVTIYT